MSKPHWADLHYHPCSSCGERIPCESSHSLLPEPTMCDKCRTALTERHKAMDIVELLRKEKRCQS